MNNFGEKVTFIWGVADLLRDAFRRSKYPDVILPLTVLRRIDCVLEPTKEAVLKAHGKLKGKLENLAPQLCKASGFAFYNTSPFNFERLLGDAPHLAANLKSYINSFSDNMREVLEKFDFDNTIAKLNESGLLFLVLERFKNIDLHPDQVSNLEMGYIFEELIRKFNEAMDENPGEHFTPREVIRLMVNLLMARDKDTLAQNHIVRTVYDPCCGSGGMLSVREGNDASFFRYLHSALYSGRLNTRSIKQNTGIQNLDSSSYLGETVAIPACPEQRLIATFLDHKTTKITALVAKKERLIELLLEKRAALISHVVTKGLDLKVPMKDSGIEWLGEVPAHWGVIQSKRVFRVRNEPAVETDEQLTASQKYGMLPQVDFIELEGRRVVATLKGTESLRHVEPNDFVISLRSFQGGIEWCGLRGSVTFHYVVLRPVKQLHPAYFGYLFKSSVYIQALRSTTDFIRDGQDLRYSHFMLIPLPVVPPDEQIAIATILDRETARIDSLVKKVQEAIDRLREYRITLISAAVTGRIDVREEVA